MPKNYYLVLGILRMSDLKTVETMGIMFNRMQNNEFNLIEWDIQPEKGVVMTSDSNGNLFKITIEPQKEQVNL